MEFLQLEIPDPCLAHNLTSERCGLKSLTQNWEVILNNLVINLKPARHKKAAVHCCTAALTC